MKPLYPLPCPQLPCFAAAKPLSVGSQRCLCSCECPGLRKGERKAQCSADCQGNGERVETWDIWALAGEKTERER